MEVSDKVEMSRVLLGLAAIMPNAKVTPEALEVWFGAMRDWDIADFRAAASHLAKTCRFMPTPYDFEQVRKAGTTTSAEAFAQALAHCASGQWRQVPHPDRAIELAVQGLGGWRAMAFCEEDKTHFLEKRFAEHYAELTDKRDTIAALPGIVNAPKLAGPAPADRLLGRLLDA
jgi:hypothetical protein